MEAFHLPYEDILRIPSTRRRRLIAAKVELEKKRADNVKKK